MTAESEPMSAESEPLCAEPAGRLLIGVDIADVGRIASIPARPDQAARVFSERELQYAAGRRNRDQHLAARFAAKEAVFKALGTGLSAGVRWRDVEVVNGAGGRPRLRLHGMTRRIADRLDVQSMEISLSHSAGLAIACAAMLCGGPAPHGGPAPCGDPVPERAT